MKTRIALAFAAFTIFLGGCAAPSQRPLQLAPAALDSKADRVGVVMKVLPKADTYLDGAGCLLCYAAASMANASLMEYSKTLTTEDLSNLKNDIADVLRKKGLNVSVIADDINFETLPDFDTRAPKVAHKDFSALKNKYNVDKLVVITVERVGMLRTYSAYIPTSDPKALFQGTVFLVNLTNNTYEWYLPIRLTKSSDGAWDEPPKFPGLTNAYFQVLEKAKDRILEPLKD